MREKLMPWVPAILCAGLALITVVADVVGRFMTGTAHAGLTAFIGFLPMCFFHVGVMLKTMRDENRELKRRLDEVLQNESERKNAA